MDLVVSPPSPETTKIRFRRGTPEQWSAKDPILDEGEPGYAFGDKNFKIGDGFSRWSELDYFLQEDDLLPEDDEDAMAAIQAHINSLTPHPVYDDGPSFALLYQNAKV